MSVDSCDDFFTTEERFEPFKPEIRTHCQSSSFLQDYASIYRSLELRPKEGQMTQEIMSGGYRLRTGLGHILRFVYPTQYAKQVRRRMHMMDWTP